MKATLSPPANSQNEIYTYIAIPIEALQQSTDQGGQALTVAQNVILKTLPDGQQIQSITMPENIIFRVNKKINFNQTSNDVQSLIAKSETENRTSIQNTTRPTVIEHNSNSNR
ncbi:hypothetical protein ILUMI_10740 [Ignelater luminosus]|uniref:Uncharacterized protein n=1 Tax=Ignelater luminosus TaxID=2038154 RepID=A0A8K0D1J5_IGNLU|nr:hypothetical protein ILUMI_10740 [Ignelater luminosus]